MKVLGYLQDSEFSQLRESYSDKAAETSSNEWQIARGQW